MRHSSLKHFENGWMRGTWAATSDIVGWLGKNMTRAHAMPLSITYTEYSTSLSASTSNYAGCVVAQNGKVYFAPSYETRIGEFDPTTNTFGFSASGSSVGGTAQRYWGGVLGANGKVYFIPYTHSDICIYDPVTDTFSKVFISNVVQKYVGGCLINNNTILMAPNNETNIGLFDTSTNTFTSGPALTGCSGAVLLPTNEVLMPRSSGTDAIYNIGTGGVRYSANHGSYATFSPTMTPSGKIAMPPNAASLMNIYDPHSDKTSSISLSATVDFGGACVMADGRIFCYPMSPRVGVGANIIYLVDTVTCSYETVTTAAAGNNFNWWGSCLVSDGRIVLAPYQLNKISVLDFGHGNIGVANVIHPLVNKSP